MKNLKKGVHYPEWMTEAGLKTLQSGYLLGDETPKDLYKRVSEAAARRLNKPYLEEKFFDYIWKGWLCPATPVMCNMGTERGLPISCYSIHVGDSVDSIFLKQHELAMLSKNGGGVGIYIGDVRGRGSEIKNNGQSEGVVPWIKCYDSTTIAVSQGSTRRGSSAAYLPIDHPDIEEFLQIRRPKGDVNRQCLNIHHAVSVTDDFMNKVEKGDKKARDTWKEILKTRFETGEPYLFFVDNVNKVNPISYVNNNLKVSTSNICSEITLYTDVSHTFVCCLSSLNLARWDEWKDTDLIYTAIWFLDGVMQEFIDRAKSMIGFESAVRFAEKGRSLGLGVLGYHSLLQNKNLPFDSLQSIFLNREIFKKIREQSEEASQDLAKEYGEPEWCKGTGFRNTHRLAIAPTVSNSKYSGEVSSGIEPITANAYADKTAKGTFMYRNLELEKLLENKGHNTTDIWNSIVVNEGSVQHLDFLSAEEKEVFLTAREINQFAIVRNAADRQKFIDQAQSINLFFPVNSTPKYISEVHFEAWRLGVKTLYYCRTGSVIKGDSSVREYERKSTECAACEG